MDYWYAQISNIDGHYIQPIIDPHYIFVNNRSRCCSKGMTEMGIAPNAWWRAAQESQENGTELSWVLAKELKNRQSNVFAQTTFSSKVKAAMEANDDLHEARNGLYEENQKYIYLLRVKVICDRDKNIRSIHSGFRGHDNDANAYYLIGPIGPGDALDFPPVLHLC